MLEMNFIIQNLTTLYKMLNLYYKIELYPTIYEWKCIIYDVMATRHELDTDKFGNEGFVV